MKSLDENMVFSGTIVSGKLAIDHPAYYRTRIGKLADGKVQIVIRKVKNKRSEAQNRLYWVFLTAIADETGNDDVLALHEHFKQRFLFRGVKKLRVGGNVVDVPIYGSTTDLSKGEFIEYMMSIEAESGVAIPDLANYDYAPTK